MNYADLLLLESETDSELELGVVLLEGMRIGITMKPAKTMRRRHCVTPYQYNVLRAVFEETPHPPPEKRRQLAATLGLSYDRIMNWFHNQREKEKRQLRGTLSSLF